MCHSSSSTSWMWPIKIVTGAFRPSSSGRETASLLESLKEIDGFVVLWQVLARRPSTLARESQQNPKLVGLNLQHKCRQTMVLFGSHILPLLLSGKSSHQLCCSSTVGPTKQGGKADCCWSSTLSRPLQTLSFPLCTACEPYDINLKTHQQKRLYPVFRILNSDSGLYLDPKLASVKS